MIILAFDTAMGAGSVAVVRDGVSLAQCFEPNGKALAEQLVPMVEATLTQAGQTYASIDCLGVTIGPGTFTGMRIGISAARAMALASGKPLIGVSTLEVIARQVADAMPDETRINVCFDARRGEVYQQSFERTSEDDLLPLSEPGVYLHAVAQEFLARQSGIIIGSGIAVLQNITHLQCVEGYEKINVQTLASIVAQRPASPEMPLPLYLRAPDAKLPGGKTLTAS